MVAGQPDLLLFGSRIVPANNKNLKDEEKEIIIVKVLQKKPWGNLNKKLTNKVSGKKEALALLRKAIGKLLQN